MIDPMRGDRVQVLTGAMRGTYGTCDGVMIAVSGNTAAKTQYGLILDGHGLSPAAYAESEFRVIQAPPLTPFKLRLLQLVRSHELEMQQGIHARRAAEFLWPDSPAWGKRTRGSSATGFNGAQGGNMPRRAASELHKLTDLGLLAIEHTREHQPLWVTTIKGRDALAAYRG